jgi:hypothetical protein
MSITHSPVRKRGSINIEPSWETVAEIALALIDNGTAKGQLEGRKLVRDMGAKLAAIRSQQSDAPDHLA